MKANTKNEMEETPKYPKWGVTDEELERLKPFGFTDKFAVSDFIDETGLGPNGIAEVLETAAKIGYIVPKGLEYYNTGMYIRTQLPHHVGDVLNWLDER